MSQISSNAQQNCHESVKRPLRLWTTYLSARNTCTKRIVTDANLFINNGISKVVPAPCHRANKHCYIVGIGYILEVGRKSDGWRITR